MRKQSIVVLGVALVMIVASLVMLGRRHWGQSAEEEVATLQFVKDAQPVPEMVLATLDGGTLSTSDLAGKVILVNFWATWCPPCREEIPAFVAMQERYGDQLQIIGISMDEGSPDEVRSFAEAYGINYPIVMATDELHTTFPGVFALPTTFVLDPEQRTVQRHVGLISPAIYELETRVLTGLPVDFPVNVEYVEDTGQVVLANAALATELPGLDMSHLTEEQKTAALQRLNTELCTCGCGLTIAQCRINDASCATSPKLAQAIVDEESLN